MFTTTSRSPALHEYTNNRDIAYGCSAAPNAPDTAVTGLDSTYSQARPNLVQPHCQSVRYTTFPNTTRPCTARPRIIMRTFKNDIADIGEGSGTQLLASTQVKLSRPISSDHAAHCTDRADGGELATIIERRSQSTLDCHNLLLASKKRSSTRQMIDGRRRSVVPPRCHSLHQRGPSSVAEDACHGTLANAELAANVISHDSSKLTVKKGDTGVSNQGKLQVMQPLRLSQPEKANCDLDSNAVTRFLRGIIELVRDAPQPTPTLSINIPLGTNEDYGMAGQGNSGSDVPERTVDESVGNRSKIAVVQALGPVHGSSLTSPLPREPCQHCGATIGTTSGLSAHDHQPVTKARLSTPTSHCDHEPTPPSPVSPSLASSSARSIPAFVSARSIPANQSLSAIPQAVQYAGDNLRAHLAYDEVPLYRPHATSLHQNDCARNASVCSTASTSYSGPVLGIDLDLQDYVGDHTSATPLRLAPRFANKPQYALTASNDAQIVPWAAKKHPPPHRSITSSALPVLLPLALASGIVRPNHATPQISFVSPSGNLIQADSSSSSPTSITSSYHHAYPLLSDFGVCIHPPELLSRPALLPAASPPHSSVPLPKHLQHHRHQHAPSHIIPQKVLPSIVKGCDGVVRIRSFTPRSGLERPLRRKKPSPPSCFRADQDSSQCHTITSCTSPQDYHEAARPLHSKGTRKATIGPFVRRTLRLCFRQRHDCEGELDAMYPGQNVDRFHEHAHKDIENARVASAAGVVNGTSTNRRRGTPLVC